ncbi:hypothetical protein KCP70_21025 [Salmonella enterica subsp. enterica]|nr:hypothetical protein KCP70_21025 [Salmonella enterica subsp. enterica]
MILSMLAKSAAGRRSLYHDDPKMLELGLAKVYRIC